MRLGSGLGEWDRVDETRCRSTTMELRALRLRQLCILAFVTSSWFFFRECRAGPGRPSVTDPSSVTRPTYLPNVATLAFGLRPRQGGCEVAGLEVDPEVTSHASGSAKSPESVREWTLTLPSKLPCWELVRVGVPKGLPELQRAFWGVKNPWRVALFISMESSWSVDV